MTDHELDVLLNQWEPTQPPARLRARFLSAAQPKPRLRWWIPAACAGLLAAAAFLQLAPHNLGFSTSPLAGGAQLRTSTLLQTGLSPSAWLGRFGTTGSFGPTHALRYLYDRNSRTYTGYLARITPAGPGAWTVAIEPAAAPPPGEAATYRQTPLPVLPAPRTIHEGESFDLETSATPRVFDRLEVSAQGFPPSTLPPAPRYLDAEMRFAAPRLSIDGQFVAEGALDARGLSLWMELPGDGRYVLAVVPDENPRFVQAGSVEGKAMEFHANGHTFRIESSEIVAGSTARPLYLLHDPARVEELNFGSGGAAGLYR